MSAEQIENTGLFPQTLLWHELHYYKIAGNADDIYRIICICNESVQDSETNTLQFFVSVPIFA